MSTSDSLVNQAVATALRGLRGETRLTLDDVSERSGLSRSTVRRLLAGDTDITATNLTALTAAMGSSPTEVMRRVFDTLDYDTAFQDAAIRVTGRRVSDVPNKIVSMDEKRAAALLDQAHADGTERIAADINEEADHDEPEAP